MTGGCNVAALKTEFGVPDPRYGLTFIGTSGRKSRLLHLVFTLARGSGEVTKLFIDRKPVVVNHRGKAVGKYKGLVRAVFNPTPESCWCLDSLRWFDAAGQEAVPLIKGFTQVYLQVRYNPRVFRSGLPEITFGFSGREHNG